MKKVLLAVVAFLFVTITFAQKSKLFLDKEQIIYSKKRIVNIDSASLKWGRNVLNDLKLDGLSNTEKAKKINQFLYKEFKYNGKRRLIIADIIKKKNGFCISHALMGIFLLRLADVPAKFAHEVHIMKRGTILSLIIGRYAKRNNDGINSYWHNDHVWVWFDAGDRWEPFDSGLGICGFEELFKKRYFEQKKYSKGMIAKWTGPPFVVWEDTGSGLREMNNVTSKVWKHELLNDDYRMKKDWLELVNMFDDWTKKDFYKQYLDDDKIELVKNSSKYWFKGNN